MTRHFPTAAQTALLRRRSPALPLLLCALLSATSAPITAAEADTTPSEGLSDGLSAQLRDAPAEVRSGPAAAFAQAVRYGAEGRHSLARSYLDPVLLTPRLTRSARARAYYLRGLLFYRDGAYVSAGQDYRRALEFMPTLREARTALAWLHLHGLGVERDARRAEHLYRLAARQGHREAQYNLALLLARGDRVARREHEAVTWFERAAAQGRSEAAGLAGQLLARMPEGLDGEALAARRDRAERWLRVAADEGDAAAVLRLAELLADHGADTLLPTLKGIAEGGMPVAQRRLGELLLQGADGIEADPERAVVWLREAAKQGDPRAQAWLGWAYDTGSGVRASPAQALRWYTRAARAEDATAQVNLALLYQQGRGTDVRPDLARRWFERAAAQGEINALSSLAWLLATAQAEADRDAERALTLARSAVAAQEDLHSLEALAAALAESGRFAEAVVEQRRALSLLDAGGDAALRDALEERLDAYRSERAWRAR